MNIFISYSVNDIKPVRMIANYISCHGQVFYWDKSREPGKEVWPLIFQWIDQSDIVIAVITDNTVRRAMAVGQELGHAKAKQKLIIPLVTSNVKASDLGFLSGIIYEKINPHNLGPALMAAEKAILQRRQQIQKETTIFVVGGILALLIAGSQE